MKNPSFEELFLGSPSRTTNPHEDDEESLKWVAIQKLPTYNRLRTGLFIYIADGDHDDGSANMAYKEVDVKKLTADDRQQFIKRNFKVPEIDNEKFLRKFRDRIDKVGIKLPTVEVRFEQFTVKAHCYVGTRALPTLINTAKNIAESALGLCGIRLTKRKKHTILKDISGIIRPSRMTLLLGPPSSGKTTLLLALAGQLDSGLKVKGQVTYNGYKLDEIVPQKTSAYVSQNDVHLGELTVKETLDYSARFQGVGDRYDLIKKLCKRETQGRIHPDSEVDIFMKAIASEGVENSLMTDYMLKLLGLDICKDTVIGDEMTRGISGGQKKRVTTGELVVGPKKTLFMDEISTGLDSSTTYQIVKCMQQITHFTEATILMSLLQPDPETFDLFDDIILLSEGQIVYQGPREYVLEFFETVGFKCPERKGVADFLQEVTSKKYQEQYWADSTKPYQYISVPQLWNKFKSFHPGLDLLRELSTRPNNNTESHKSSLVLENYNVPNLQLLKASFDREKLFIKRTAPVYYFKIIKITTFALVASTVFFRTTLSETYDDGGLYMGALIFSMVVNMYNGFPELPMAITRLPVFYKHRSLKFYPAWIFVLPNFLLRVPITIVESAVWTVITYFTIGYTPEASRFFKHLLVMILIQQMAAGLFKLMAGICRSMIIALSGGSLALLFLFLLGGFVIPQGRVPEWLSWGHWISPLSYAFKALTTNEMLASRWMNKLAPDNATTLGVALLKKFDIESEKYWYWTGVGALLGFVILFNVLYTISLVYLNPVGKPQAVTPEVENEQSSEGLAERTEKNKMEPGSNTREIITLKETSPSMISEAEAKEDNPNKGMILPFKPLSMSFDNVNYYVDMPSEMKSQGVAETRLQLLRDVTGAFRPRILTALMGVSGAGKTTLMDVLAGRKTGGYIEGDIRISGFPKKQETFARISGYCEQTDIHSPQVTVRESLIFSAFLRLPEAVSNKDKMIFVDEVMELVELDNLKNAIVGLPGISGLSTEQRKRLTIAVELVANPSIIFMDEPTSGLDARAAAVVMKTVRNTVDTGRTVVCTIHQPSIDIFESFDELLLMKRGGQVIYSGPLGRNSHQVIEYFQAIPGVVRIREKQNPAAWMLEASSEATEVRLGIDFAEHYRSSALYTENKTLVKQLITPPEGAEDLHFPTQHSRSMWEQFKSCLWKQWWTYWRSPAYNLVRLFFGLTAALVLGAFFWQVGTKREDANDLIMIIGAMYVAVSTLGINNCYTAQPVISVERTVFYRERAAGMYSALPYALAQVIIEIPYVFVQVVVYTCIVYAMVSFEWTLKKFMWFFFITYFSLLYFTYYGMLSVAVTPNPHAAAILSSAFYDPFGLFSGFFIPMPRIPKWWLWYMYVCPVSWTVYGLIVTQYGDVEDTIKVPGISPDPSIKWYVHHHFGYDLNFAGPVAAILVGFAAFFALMFAVSIKVLNFQHR